MHFGFKAHFTMHLFRSPSIISENLNCNSIHTKHTNEQNIEQICNQHKEGKHRHETSDEEFGSFNSALIRIMLEFSKDWRRYPELHYEVGHFVEKLAKQSRERIEENDAAWLGEQSGTITSDNVYRVVVYRN